MPAKRLTTKILEFFKENPGSGIKDLSQYLSISLGIARSIVYRLKNNGFLAKAGSGYILTSKGEWLLERMLEEDTHKQPKRKKETMIPRESLETMNTGVETGKTNLNQHVTEPLKADSSRSIRVEAGNDTLREVIARIEYLEEKVKKLEESLESITRELRKLKAETPIVKPAPKRKIEEKKILPQKIIYMNEARSILGSLFDKLVYQGKIVVIGGLVVDKAFYDEFISKFPLTIKEAEKLSPMEKRLLEEMKREAKVILRAGKRYEVIEH